MLAADAEDVVQEAFCNAMRYVDAYVDKEKLENWFGTILSNAANDFARQERRTGMTSDEDELTDDLDTIAFREEMVSKVLGEIEAEPDEDVRRALTANVLYQWKPGEIATWSPLSGGHIRILIHRFKVAMREKYGDELYG